MKLKMKFNCSYHGSLKYFLRNLFLSVLIYRASYLKIDFQSLELKIYFSQYFVIDLGEKESLNIQVQSLESKVQALSRSNQVMEGEISTLKTQMEAREKALKDVESELELANSQLELDKGDDRKQQKMDKLVAQVSIGWIVYCHIFDKK